MTDSYSTGTPLTFTYINKLQSKRILIFGGTSGFGYAISEAAIESGANVIISGSNPERLSKTIERLQSTYQGHIRPDQISTAICDLSELDTLSSRLESLLKHVTDDGSKKLDHIVYTADNAYPIPAFGDTTPQDNNPLIRPLAHFWIVLEQDLLLISDLYERYLRSPTSTRLGRSRDGGHSTRRTGPVKTELLAELPEEYLKMYAEETLTKQLGRVEDVAESYLYLMKDGAVTGSVLATDGGRRIA